MLKSTGITLAKEQLHAARREMSIMSCPVVSLQSVEATTTLKRGIPSRQVADTTTAGSPQSGGAVSRHRGPFGSLSSSPCHQQLTLTCPFAVSCDVDHPHPSLWICLTIWAYFIITSSLQITVMAFRWSTLSIKHMENAVIAKVI